MKARWSPDFLDLLTALNAADARCSSSSTEAQPPNREEDETEGESKIDCSKNQPRIPASEAWRIWKWGRQTEGAVVVIDSHHA